MNTKEGVSVNDQSEIKEPFLLRISLTILLGVSDSIQTKVLH